MLALRRCGGLLEGLGQVEHACGSCPMSPVCPASGPDTAGCRESGLEASRARERRLELRVAELERRLSMDSTDSGTPSSKERIGAKETRRARQESERERRKDRRTGGQPGHQGKGLKRDPDPDPDDRRAAEPSTPSAMTVSPFASFVDLAINRRRRGPRRRVSWRQLPGSPVHARARRCPG